MKILRAHKLVKVQITDTFRDFYFSDCIRIFNDPCKEDTTYREMIYKIWSLLKTHKTFEVVLSELKCMSVDSVVIDGKLFIHDTFTIFDYNIRNEITIL